jgi:hypothetical protein
VSWRDRERSSLGLSLSGALIRDSAAMLLPLPVEKGIVPFPMEVTITGSGFFI